MIDRSKLLARYVQELIDKGVIRSTHVEHAFRCVERDRFLRRFYHHNPHQGGWEQLHHDPENPDQQLLRLIYSDQALVTLLNEKGMPISSTSQPALVAHMLELLELHPGARVLEIGTGTGYNAALLSEIVGEQGVVTTLDIREELINQAQQIFSSLGYRNIQALCRDGFYGASEYGPYDRIVATVGCTDISPHWLEQLAPEGFMLIPLQHGGLSSHPLVRIWLEKGQIIGRVMGWSGFMPIQGELAWAGKFWAESPWTTRVPPCVLQGEPVDSRPLPPGLPPTADAPLLQSTTHQAFYFFLTLNDQRACATLKGYGLVAPEAAVVITGQQILLYSQDAKPNEEPYQTTLALYHAWQELGSPCWGDYRLQFLPASGAPGQLYKRQGNSWVVTRKWFEQLTQLSSTVAA